MTHSTCVAFAKVSNIRRWIRVYLKRQSCSCSSVEHQAVPVLGRGFHPRLHITIKVLSAAQEFRLARDGHDLLTCLRSFCASAPCSSSIWRRKYFLAGMTACWGFDSSSLRAHQQHSSSCHNRLVLGRDCSRQTSFARDARASDVHRRHSSQPRRHCLPVAGALRDVWDRTLAFLPGWQRPVWV